MIRSLILVLLALSLHAVDESPRVEPTRVDRIQGIADPSTGRIESVQVWDVQDAVDSLGQRRQIGERSTIITRADAPALFAALDAILTKTAERDAGHRAKRAEAKQKNTEKKP